MKKKLFHCFQPMAIETAEEHPISPPIIGPKQDMKKSLSQKIKISAGRNIHRLSLQLKNNNSLRKIYTHSKISDDVIDDDSQETETTSSKNMTSSSSSITEGKSPPLIEENVVRKKPCCSCTKINPGLYLFVLTLFFTTVCGRATAVFFTLVLFYLFPLVFRPAIGKKSPELVEKD
ncbi:hypothetical protein ABFS83_13G023200 [Erythranthe nasuta]